MRTSVAAFIAALLMTVAAAAAPAVVCQIITPVNGMIPTVKSIRPQRFTKVRLSAQPKRYSEKLVKLRRQSLAGHPSGANQSRPRPPSDLELVLVDFLDDAP